MDTRKNQNLKNAVRVAMGHKGGIASGDSRKARNAEVAELRQYVETGADTPATRAYARMVAVAYRRVLKADCEAATKPQESAGLATLMYFVVDGMERLGRLPKPKDSQPTKTRRDSYKDAREAYDRANAQ